MNFFIQKGGALERGAKKGTYSISKQVAEEIWEK